MADFNGNDLAELEAAFTKGANLLKLFAAGAEAVDKLRAALQYQGDLEKNILLLKETVQKLADDKALADEALAATREEAKRITQETEAARQDILKAAKLEAADIIDAAKKEQADLNAQDAELRVHISDMTAVKNDLAAEIVRLNKEKADFLAKLTG